MIISNIYTFWNYAEYSLCSSIKDRFQCYSMVNLTFYSPWLVLCVWQWGPC